MNGNSFDLRVIAGFLSFDEMKGAHLSDVYQCVIAFAHTCLLREVHPEGSSAIMAVQPQIGLQHWVSGSQAVKLGLTE